MGRIACFIIRVRFCTIGVSKVNFYNIFFSEEKIMIAISAESTIDLPKEILNKYDIHTVPFTVIMGDKDYLDGEIKNEDLFKFVNMNKILTMTSAVNEYQYENHFKTLLKDYDAVIHISLSSKLSSAYTNACNVASQFDNVYVVDSTTLSTGIALLAIKACIWASEGKDAKTIKQLLENTKSRVQASFVLDKLDYLYKGGRCSALSVFGANLLRIKPQIILKDGKMQVGKKYVGSFESCAKKYIDDTLKKYDTFDYTTAFFTYTTTSQSIKDYAIKKLKDVGFKNVYTTTAGSTISSHCGPNTLGILFVF